MILTRATYTSQKKLFTDLSKEIGLQRADLAFSCQWYGSQDQPREARKLCQPCLKTGKTE